MRLMWVTMPSASLLLGPRTKPVPFIRSVPSSLGFILSSGRTPLPGRMGSVAGTSGDTSQPNIHAAWRMAEARRAAQAYQPNPKLAALAVAGSVGSGLADQFSDLELE